MHLADVHLADVHARAGDADAAVTAAMRAAEIARLTRSVRLHAMLTRLHGEIAARWPTKPGSVT